jgi:hypothetical protein
LTRAFWINWRAGLITQWRACAEGGEAMSELRSVLLEMIRVVERHAGLPAFDPDAPPARRRRSANPAERR